MPAVHVSLDAEGWRDRLAVKLRGLCQITASSNQIEPQKVRLPDPLDLKRLTERH